MKKSMDLFGKALLAYANGDKSKFFFADSSGNKYEHPLSKYFRDYKQFTKLERKIISLSRGNILDLGCGTGNYIPYLMKRGKVLGIDISPRIIQVAKKRYKLKNVLVANIFNFKTAKKFDTIVLLENNLGLGQTISKTKKLLKLLTNLLNKNGQILTNGKNIPDRDYFVGELIPIYRGLKGPGFGWISFNTKYLKKLCNELGLKLEIINRDKGHYLAKITRKSK